MDQRLQTFLNLCQTMNYRQTAEEIGISQPAVTKQIQSLEEELEVELFWYDKRTLYRSQESYILERYAQAQQYNYLDLRRQLSKQIKPTLRVGLTKTVGEYVILEDLSRYLQSNDYNFELVMDNTETLLSKLERNELEFLVVEGNFSKADFAYRLLSQELFTGICSQDHPFAGRQVSLEEVMTQSLIVREPGSGNREILQKELEAFSYKLEDFPRLISISSIQITKDLLSKNLGISFAYQAIIRDHEPLACFQVDGISAYHEFNIVALKNTPGMDYASRFFQRELSE